MDLFDVSNMVWPSERVRIRKKLDFYGQDKTGRVSQQQEKENDANTMSFKFLSWNIEYSSYGTMHGLRAESNQAKSPHPVLVYVVIFFYIMRTDFNWGSAIWQNY